MGWVMVGWEVIQTLLILGVGLVVALNYEEVESFRDSVVFRVRRLEDKWNPRIPETYDDDEENQEDDVVQGEIVGDSGTGETGTVHGVEVVSGAGEQPEAGVDKTIAP